MKQGIYKVLSNKALTSNVYEMVLSGDTSEITKSGQFINIKLDGLFLRRPISICDYDENSIKIIYKVVGKGTEVMSKMQGGESLDVLVGLGNGFEEAFAGDTPLLIGGGVGVPPMYNMAKRLIEMGKQVTVIIGFNKADEVFYESEFKNLGCKVIVTTVDGSYGTKGFVSDVIKDVNYSYHYVCGPLPMLKAVYSATEGEGDYSFEERMGCGFGACVGCTCKTKYGNKRICKDGPVLFKGEIIW